jgi:hypothetical protein
VGKENKWTKQAEKEPRTRLIGLRLSEAEYSRIDDELLVCGLSLSTFVRKSVDDPSRVTGRKMGEKVCGT